ncbi:MAG: hypothetical protein ACYTA5_21770 [Planctomycetota bacterium]|jgi:hypothetical protein
MVYCATCDGNGWVPSTYPGADTDACSDCGGTGIEPIVWLHCKTCRWWTEEVGSRGWRICHHPKLYENSDFHDRVSDDGAQGDRDNQSIVAGPEFGCVHHEKKQ